MQTNHLKSNVQIVWTVRIFGKTLLGVNTIFNLSKPL